MGEDFYNNIFTENNYHLYPKEKIDSNGKIINIRIRWGRRFRNLIDTIDISSSDIGEAKKATEGDSILASFRGVHNEMWREQTKRMKKLRNMIDLILENVDKDAFNAHRERLNTVRKKGLNGKLGPIFRKLRDSKEHRNATHGDIYKMAYEKVINKEKKSG